MTTQFSTISASESIGMIYIGVAKLAVLLDRAPSTVYTQNSREPWLLPPQPTNKTTSKPQWLLATVWQWMKEQSATNQVSVAPIQEALRKSKRGPPTNAEKLAAKNAGLSVPEYRISLHV